MKITPVTDKLSVADQPSEAEIAALAGRGVRLVINNRPDGEEAAQPGSAAERR
ncbi:beta-lactamase hydrolase domain-containing protein, partial [Methylobacterium hispanicum]